jgi:hypothetical protein
MGSERLLGLHYGVDRINRAWENSEERITLGVYNASMIRFECLAQKLLLVGEQIGVLFAQLLQEPRRAFYVGKQ